MLNECLQNTGNLVENFFREQIGDQPIPEPLNGAMMYSLMAGGKRLRPALLLEANKLFGGDQAEALPFASALEMIHTYSLIHDDLPGMDDDDYRRGKPTNHKVYGEGMAILAGDGLLNRAYEVMAAQAVSTPERAHACVRAMQVIAAGAGVMGMVAGQCVDLDSEGKQVAEETLDYIHTHKTADLIIAPLKAGAILAGAEEASVQAIEAYGQKIGLAFQITDDLLDVEGDAQVLGKATGRDAVLNKQTFPQRYGIDGARQIASACIAEAKAIISRLPGDVTFFTELADFILNRKK